MNPSYIAKNLDELFDSCPLDIQELIYGGEVNSATAVLGKIYALPVGKYTVLANIITFIMIGALKPEDVLQALVDMLGVTEDEAFRLAQDMEKSILEKARIKILGKSSEDMVTLTFGEGRTPDDLRKEILDTTKKESVFAEADASKEMVMETPTPTSSKKNVFAPAGSRTQLLEQLQMLDTIPNDAEIETRLQKIREQISGMSPQEEASQPKAPLANFMSQGDGSVTVPEQKPATYSRAPTQYNVDPYREVVE